jgi:NDP-sugar pyrophosphorylase family protein
MNIIFGLCGEGSRFRNAGYTIPKYLIEYNGATMLEHAVKTLGIPGNVYFIVRQDHLNQFPQIEPLLKSLGAGYVTAPGLTEGAAQSMLLIKDHINLDEPFITANCDQYMDWDPSDFIQLMHNNPTTSFIITYKETSPKCSYIKKEAGKIVEVREKKVLSNDATVGIYHWAKGLDFFRDAETMIQNRHKENNEYYIAPVYNYSIDQGLDVQNFEVDGTEFWPVGTPEDLEKFKNENRSH